MRIVLIILFCSDFALWIRNRKEIQQHIIIMIYSRLWLNSMHKAPRLLHPIAFSAFSITRKGSQGDPDIKRKIQEVRSINGLLSIFQQNQSSFKPFFLQALVKLNILDLKDYYDRQRLFNFYRAMNQLNIDQYSESEMVTIISVIRKLQSQGFRNTKQLKLSILRELANNFQNRTYTDQSKISELAKFYEEYSVFNFLSLQKAIYTHIYWICSQLILTKSQCNIPIAAMNNFFKGMYYPEQLTLKQKKIRSFLLAQLNKKLHSIKLEQLLDLLQSLIRVDWLDFANAQLITINNLLDKMRQNVQNFAKQEMLRILAFQQPAGNRNKVNSIYLEIKTRVFVLIREDGFSNISLVETLELLASISYKLQYNQLQPQQQDKLIYFIRQASKLAKDSKQKSLFTILLKNVFKHTSPGSIHRQILKQTIDNISFPISLQLIFQLYRNQYYASHLIKLLIIKQRTKIYKLFIIGIVIKQIPNFSQDPTLQAIWTQIYSILESSLINPQKFVETMRKISNFQQFEILQYQILHNFPELMKKVVNPYKVQLNNYQYLQYFTEFVFRLRNLQSAATIELFPIPETEISDKLLKDMNMVALRHNKYTIKPNKQLMYLILQKFPKLINDKNVDVIRSVIALTSRYSRFLALRELTVHQQNFMWRILKHLRTNLPLFIELGLVTQVNYLLFSYFSKSFKHYSHSKQFTELIAETLSHLEVLTQCETALNQLFKAALKLRVLERKHCQNKQLLSNLDISNTQKQKIRFILDQNHEYKISNTQNTIDVQAMVFNKNSLKFITQNKQKIYETLETYSEYRLALVLSSLNLPKQQATMELIKKTLHLFLHQHKTIQFIDIGRIFSVAVAGSYFLLEGYSKILLTFISFYQTMKNKIRDLDSLTLINITKFIAAQPQKKEYYKFYDIVKIWFSFHYNYNKLFVLSCLAETNYQFSSEQIALIPKIISTYPRLGVRMFLYLQDMIQPQQRKEIVKLIVLRLQDQNRQNKQNIIQDLYYKYIKLVYPEETKELQISHEKMLQFRFSAKPNTTIMNTLNDIRDKLGIQISLNRQFGNNKVYQMNDTFIIFTSKLKTSSIHRHKFLKKLLKVVSKKNIPVFDFLNQQVKNQQIYIKLITSKGVLFTAQQIDQYIRINSQLALKDQQILSQNKDQEKV